MKRGNDIEQGKAERGGFTKAPTNPTRLSLNQMSQTPLPTQKQKARISASIFTPFIVETDVISSSVATDKPDRNYLMLQNNSDTDIFVDFGNEASVENSYLSAAGGFWELNFVVPVNSITCISTIKGKKLTVIEGTMAKFA